MPEKIVHSAEAASRPTLFFEDLREGMRRSQVWRAFAWDEMQTRYQRSVFGVLWIVISYAFFVAGVSLFFAEFSTVPIAYYIIHVAVGYATFQFLIGNVVDGCQVFSASDSWIKSSALPYSVYVYKSIFRSILPFAFQLAVAFCLMIYLGWRPQWISLLAIPAFVLFLLNAVALQYLFGLIAARYRDINHLIGAITRILIFITPILWVRDKLTGFRAILADINPLTHFVEIFRGPLLGNDPRLLNWAIALALTALVWIAAAVAAARMRRRLAFWV